MNKYVETVCGPLPIEDIGITLTHEHLYLSLEHFLPFFVEERDMTDEKVTIENRPDVVSSHHKALNVYKDNAVFDDVDMIVRELEYFKAVGGKTIFDVTPVDLMRNPLKLKEISEKSGVNVIMSCGYYSVLAMDPQTQDILLKKGPNALADHMIREFYEGVGDTGIKPGVLGEMGMHRGETERILAKAAILAQKETRAPLIFHAPNLWVLDLAEREGADLSKIVMGHWNMSWPVKEAIKRGAWVSIDQFGINYPELVQDEKRIEDVVKIFENGWDKQLLLSQDMCNKDRLKTFGGPGFDELFVTTFPKLLERGITKEQLDSVMIDNPKRLLG